MINVKEKGNRFERQIARILKEHYGYEARRGVQFRSGQEEADVVGLPGVHIECKAVERLNLEKALQQSERDARPDEIPIVVHKKNYKPIYVTLRRENIPKTVSCSGITYSGDKATMLFERFMMIYEGMR